MIERDKRAVLVTEKYFARGVIINKSYALRSVGTSEGVNIVAGSWHP